MIDRTDKILAATMSVCFSVAVVLAVYLASRGNFLPIILMIVLTAIGAFMDPGRKNGSNR